ncbi:uncharacterized protein LOC122388790 isoform X2 [Amphibalanus amphitrite]|uniref:uncharacterized protein LOC122388790 isoform X2 n=1 Tax=Amphibalanus amphitrite TaxID=1232801 RepID=UPI001C923E89|nr:uncharacterized protein LOC122388790 isoform X2 [Amphibalanus amphitrite]
MEEDEHKMSLVFRKLCSPMKLERDRGLEELRGLLPGLIPAEAEQLLAEASAVLDQPEVVWHHQLGALTCLSLIIETRQEKLPNDKISHLIELLAAYLSHQEARVRIATGELLGRLCSLHGPAVFDDVQPTLSTLILTSMQAAEDDEDKWETSSVTSRDSADVFANTSSWTVLETSLRALEQLVPAAHLQASDELLNLVIPALKHRNRFVREAGFGCLTAFLPKENFEHGSGVPPVYDFGDRLAAAIADGMDDNWSQVRMAASVAARRFLCGLSAEQRQHYLPCLLPRVCLSRYYVAEGVKIYNQRTWETIAGQRGRELVEQYINDVVEYYLVATTAENHAVREAACYCITELLKKLSPQTLAPYAERVLDALLVCFQDDSWPVRDTACLAVGRLLVAFPETCRPHLDRLYPLLFSNLHDNIPSVRQGGAEALANAVRAYGEQALTLVMNRVREDLTALKDEPEPSGPAAAPGGYAERKQQRDNDEQLHTNQTMYSCGSLAPKMAAGGCSACHRFRRPVELWEAADGSARLLAELAAAPGCGGAVSDTVPLLAAAAGRRHYSHHLQLLETVCRALPPLATGIGKRCFKTHLHLLLDTIMYSLTCESQLAAEAGRCCVQQLSGLLGPNIFRGRVENHNPSYLTTLDRFLPPPLA